MNIREDDKWILDAMGIDPSRMRNRICFDVWNDISHLRDEDMLRNGTRGVYVELLLNRKYHGLYCLSDKVNRKLLGLKKLKEEDDSLTYGVRGVLYKCQGNSPYTSRLTFPADTEHDCASTAVEDMWWVEGTLWHDWGLEYPDEYPVHKTWEPLLRLLQFTSQTDERPMEADARLDDFFYIDNLVEYSVFVLNFMLLDNVFHNSYLSSRNQEKGKQLWITPWDLDSSFGRDGYGTFLNVIADPDWVLWNSRPVSQLFADHTTLYFRRCAQCWNELKEGYLHPDAMEERLRAYADLFATSGAWERERNLWNGRLHVGAHPVVNLRETPYDEANLMADWYRRNYEALDVLFADAPSTDIVAPAAGRATCRGVFTAEGKPLPPDVKLQGLPRGVYIVNGRKVVR